MGRREVRSTLQLRREERTAGDPPAYGLEGIHKITVTGDGGRRSVCSGTTTWQLTPDARPRMWTEPRLGENVQNLPDLVSPKLAPALEAYQLSLISGGSSRTTSLRNPAPARGQLVFAGAGQCATCHAGSHYTDTPGRPACGSRTHERARAGTAGPASPRAARPSSIEPRRYGRCGGARRTSTTASPLHSTTSSSFANTRKSLNLSAQQKADLVQYLKTL